MAVDKTRSISYEHIARCATAYAEAVRRVQQDHDVQLSEDVIRARLVLADCLRDAGWTPHLDVEARLLHDQEVLGLAIGSFELTPDFHRTEGAAANTLL